MIAQLTEKIVKALEKENFIGKPQELYIPIEYALSQGGKRIRPVFALLASEILGGKSDEIIDAALALEVFHNFTLLHDDLMDKSPLRRGKETVYQKWNANIAILSGDAMSSLAFKYLIRNPKPYTAQFLNLFTQMTLEIYEGQQYDMNFETAESVTISEYMEMIRLKTAVFFATALKMGAISANASESIANLFYECGLNLGLAFQLQDDLLDCYGNTEIFGKQTGTDIMDNKKTFLFLKALELGNNGQKQTLRHYFSSTDFARDEKVNAVKNIYEQLHIRQLTAKEILYYSQKSKDALAKINVVDDKKAELIQFIDKLADREI